MNAEVIVILERSLGMGSLQADHGGDGRRGQEDGSKMIVADTNLAAYLHIETELSLAESLGCFWRYNGTCFGP